MKSTKIFGIAFFLSGTLVLLIATYFLNTAITFFSHSTTTQGVVVDIAPQPQSDLLSPIVEFELEGTTIQFQDKISSSNPDATIGEIVPIRYLVSNPSDAVIDSFFAIWGFSILLGLFGATFAMTGILILLYPVYKKRKYTYLQQHGIPLQAHIKAIEKNTNIELNGRSPYVILAYAKDGAVLHEYTSESIWFDPTDYAPIDKTVTIYVDPRKKKRYVMDISFLPTLKK